MRRSIPDSDLSHEHFTTGENQEILLQKQNCIQEARTVFQNIFLLSCKTQGFVFNIAGQKEEAYIRK